MWTVEELLEENKTLQSRVDYLEDKIKLTKMLARLDGWTGIDVVFEPDWYVEKRRELKVVTDKLEELFKRNGIV